MASETLDAHVTEAAEPAHAGAKLAAALARPGGVKAVDLIGCTGVDDGVKFYGLQLILDDGTTLLVEASEL